MYCPKCGNKLPDGVSTCENCGWSEDAGIQTSKATTKPSPKKVIIAIIAVLVILVAAFGIRMFGSTPAKKDDPAIKICGEWQSKKAGVDINTSNDLMDYKKATVTFSTDGTGAMDTLSDGINLNYTWRYCAEETEKLGDGSLVYEVTFATVYKGNIIKNLIMDCQSYTKYRPNETTGGIFVSWRRKEELPTGA